MLELELRSSNRSYLTALGRIPAVEVFVQMLIIVANVLASLADSLPRCGVPRKTTPTTDFKTSP